MIALEEKHPETAQLLKKYEAEEGFQMIKPEDLNRGKELGKGAFGVVFQATWKSRPVAVKAMNLESASVSDLAMRPNDP